MVETFTCFAQKAWVSMSSNIMLAGYFWSCEAVLTYILEEDVTRQYLDQWPKLQTVDPLSVPQFYVVFLGS